MSTRRSLLVRVAASALLTAAAMLGAHAFVPTAYGCGTVGGGNCRMATSYPGTTTALLYQTRLVLDALDVYRY